jgi:DNA polymerase-1
MKSTRAAYQLLHDGQIALARVESTGIRVDMEYLDRTRKELLGEIHEKAEVLKQSDEYSAWRRRFGPKTNIRSRRQLSRVLFEDMGYQSVTGKADQEALEKVGTPFVKQYLRWAKLEKAQGTFLAGIRSQSMWCPNQKIHLCRPFFNLDIARTFRSSSDSPNFQNFPVRDKLIAKLVRQAFIPRPGRRLVEIDYGGIEVKAAAWYHKDPVMLSYLHDPSKDMHRDMASMLFMLEDAPKEFWKTDIAKLTRYVAKNMFVFPAFYGSYFKTITPALWDAIDRFDLKDHEGNSLKDRLDSLGGITRRGACKVGGDWKERKPKPGSFESHIQSVEANFWQDRFSVYAQWKVDWFNDYLKNGGFRTLTGFWIDSQLKRNDVTNYPVQGVAFHCLLWSLIRLQKELKRRGMKALIVGQIHDSIVADVPDDELEEYLQLAYQVMVVDMKNEWKFINTPLEVEADVTPVDVSWFQKAPYEIKV